VRQALTHPADLRTRYLGFDLPNPFVVGASPLDDDIDMVMRLEDAGAAAIVMHSLFEEDIAQYGSATEAYLDRLLQIKRRVGMPVIASLNGTTAAGWLRYASLIEHSGADALELNSTISPPTAARMPALSSAASSISSPC
jgi:dihydroorotate dehydrogenase (fumarate)